jgi:hypothetical protein
MDQPMRATAAPLRWFVAVVAIVYGFAKLNGAQFTVLDSELTKPMGEVSGFWLTWYYFGRSPIYGSLLALLQVGGGILLVLPRTSLAGALLLLPMFTNIVLIDVFYGVDLGATVVAGLVVISLAAIVQPHARRLLEAVLLDAPRGGAIRFVVVSILLAGAWWFTWWTANYNNRVPTPIDGVWSAVSEPGASPPRWQRMFFERNRAHWVVFRTAAGEDQRHHFEVDERGVVRVWQTWLTKGDLIMQGHVRPDGRLELASTTGTPGRLVLKREPPVRGRRPE